MDEIDSDFEPFEDANGEIRRCGSLPMPKNRASAFPPFVAGDRFIWEMKDILRVIRHPSRVPARVTFGTKWRQNQTSHGSCNGYAEAGILARVRYKSGHTD